MTSGIRLLSPIVPTLLVVSVLSACQQAEESAPAPEQMSEPETTSELPTAEVVLAGADDHGKSKLLAALSAVLADRGAAEVRTVEEIESADDARVSYEAADHEITLVDPGAHSAVLAALRKSDAATVVLVVDQTYGPTGQTREQIQTAGDAGVETTILFLSRDHLVDDEELKDLVQMEIEEAMVQAGLIAEAEAGSWEEGAFAPGHGVVALRGSARRALEGDVAARSDVADLLDAIETAVSETGCNLGG